jgi:CubicO group peptidase (beta-lactamase class C family)
MKLFIPITRISFLIVGLSIFACKAKLVENKNDTKYFNKIDSLITKSYERDLFNGNVLVLKNNNIIFQKSFGYTDGTQQKKLDDKSIFNIGSIAKEFNSVAIMMLQERGLLNINDTISKFDLGLPDWSKKVTIRHLLNYAGGVPSIDIFAPKSDQIALEILKNSDSLLFEPGSSFLYDNSNVFLQRKIVEKVTGQSYNKFIVENIVKPLKMTNSVIDPTADYPNRTSCYDFDNVQCQEMEFISGWLWVDINDLYKWIHAMNTNALISQDSFDILLRNPYINNRTSSLGEYYEEDKLQVHDGSSYKFESIYLNDFKNDVTIILLSNNVNRVRNIGINIYNIMINEPYEILKKSIYQTIRKESFKDAELGIKAYQKLKKNFPNTYSFNNPSELNRLGYELLRAEKIEFAIKIFQLATIEFPKNANSYDSLGSGYFSNKQYDLSLSSYQKALEIEETNENAKKMIKKINKILSN